MSSGSVEELWSIHEIQQLAIRYAHAHDSRDMAALNDIFVDETTPLEWPEFNIANLREAFPDYWAVTGPTILFVTNHLIELKDEGIAEGSVYSLGRGDLGGEWIEQSILYQDRYERVDGRWRIRSRRHLLWYGIALPERPFDQPKTNWPLSPVGRGSMPADLASWREFYGIDELPEGFYASTAPTTE